MFPRLISIPLSLIALLLFAELVRAGLPGVLVPVFDFAAGDSIILSAYLVIALAVGFAALWLWSGWKRR